MQPTWRKQYLRYRSFLLNIVSHYKRRKDLKVYLEIFLSLATISLFSIFALRPTLITIGELIREIEAKEETLVVMNNKIENIAQAQRLYRSERSNIELLENAIPPAPLPDRLAYQFEGVSSDRQIPLNALSIGNAFIKGAASNKNQAAVDETQGASKISFSFQTSSSYETVKQVIDSLQNLQRLLEINSFSLSISNDQEQTISLSVEGNSLYMNDVNRSTQLESEQQ